MLSALVGETADARNFTSPHSCIHSGLVESDTPAKVIVRNPAVSLQICYVSDAYIQVPCYADFVSPIAALFTDTVC